MTLKYSMDGDQHCCVNADTFRNIQESPVGFGSTQAEARQNLFLDIGLNPDCACGARSCPVCTSPRQ